MEIRRIPRAASCPRLRSPSAPDNGPGLGLTGQDAGDKKWKDGKNIPARSSRLTMPVLAIGGDKANGELLGRQMNIVASDANIVVLRSTGHCCSRNTTETLMKSL